MRRQDFITLLVISFLFVLLVAPPSQAAGLSPELESTLLSLQDQDEISVIVTLSEKADLRQMKGRDRRFLRSTIIRALKEKASVTQSPVKAFLELRRARKIKPLWLINGMAITAPARVIQELANLPGIEEIRLDETILAPVVAQSTSAVPEWNLSAIRAPELWNLGYRGEGVVVATMDTGVDPNHPDLQAKWRGGANSWFDPHGEHDSPHDAHGHGTQVMGVLVGGDAGGTSIGVAPGAQWIAVKIFNDQGEAPLSAIHQGFQWLLDPDDDPNTDDAPDIVNNSWGLRDNVNECVLEFQDDIQALRAAGIGVTFSAGNAGPNPSTSISPANNPESLAVGSVDSSLHIELQSSRGPSACGGGTYPTMVAPGLNVRTSDLTLGGTNTNPYTIVSGTSFSAPHVAGTMALLRGALSDLTVSEMESVLTQSALDLGTSGPDNDYGYGLADAFEAYLEAHQLLFGQDIYDIIVRYYHDILGRDPEPGGLESWIAEIGRVNSLGIDIKGGFATITKVFFNSEEYLQKNKADSAYVEDLYRSFLIRVPSRAEIDSWIDLLMEGIRRDGILNHFAFSEEFGLLLEGIFGMNRNRPENDLVNDFYRGFLGRLPDTEGFNYWLQIVRNTQCLGSEQVWDASYQMAFEFVHSTEYASQNKDNIGYVEDLYDGILRRGPDIEGLNFWVTSLVGETFTRDQVLNFFVDSPEFQQRVQELMDTGCLQF